MPKVAFMCAFSGRILQCDLAPPIITCNDTIVTVETKLTLDNITRVIQDKSF